MNDYKWAIAQIGTTPSGNGSKANDQAHHENGSDQLLADINRAIDQSVGTILRSTAEVLSRTETIDHLLTRAVEEREALLSEIEQARRECKALTARFQELQTAVETRAPHESEPDDEDTKILSQARSRLQLALHNSRRAEEDVVSIEKQASTLLNELLSPSPGSAATPESLAANAALDFQRRAQTPAVRTASLVTAVAETEPTPISFTTSADDTPETTGERTTGDDQEIDRALIGQEGPRTGPTGSNHYQILLQPVHSFGQMEELERSINRVPAVDSVKIAGWNDLSVTLALVARVPRDELIDDLVGAVPGARLARVENTEIGLALPDA